MKFSFLEAIQWNIQRFLAYSAGLLFECRWIWLKNLLIRIFIHCYSVDLKDCVKTQVRDYASLNDFFTRSLRVTARPFEASATAVLSPVDGCISHIGHIEGDILLQAKGKSYTLYDLLAGDQGLVDLFQHGNFCTFYLSPADYHRVHMPIAAEVVHTTYVPGFLLSVGARNTKRVSQLFTRNERMISLFKSAIGAFAVIQVGSSLVGHMGTNWETKNTTARPYQTVTRVDYSHSSYSLAQGDEMGYFKLGSVVIMLFASEKMEWDENLYLGKRLHYGEKIGETLPRGIKPLFTP